ncbi:MAG: alpha/beta hydrolase [Actinomycetota bacterium]|nr:alpha/beta hydrolase [Actinomycetota bacterium]
MPFYEEVATRVDLIVPEHPGFGDTVMPEWLEDFDDVALHYDDLVDALGLETFHLVGHSLGGWMAAHYAVLFSARLRSLQLIAPAGLRRSALTDPFRQSGEEALDRTFNGAADHYPEYLEEDDPLEQKIHDYIELTTRARLQWNPRYDVRLDRRLARVKTPTQVIIPDEDRILDASVVARYAELIPGARLTRIEGTDRPTSHVPFVQEPKLLADMVANFVTENSEDR